MAKAWSSQLRSLPAQLYSLRLPHLKLPHRFNSIQFLCLPFNFKLAICLSLGILSVERMLGLILEQQLRWGKHWEAMANLPTKQHL
jgi:hypothetical protein